jgi:hypothetical protein
MSTIDEIERAIESLPASDVARLTDRLIERRNEAWNRQMNEDAEGGKLDFLFQEADEERKAGTLHDWPPRKQPRDWLPGRGHG